MTGGRARGGAAPDPGPRSEPGPPPEPGPPSGLQGILADLAALLGARERVTLGEVLDALGARGHGPILLVLAALTMLPTGMIPVVPTIVGALLVLVAAEMVVGGEGVSVPRRLARLSLPAAPLRAGLARAAPLSARLGRVLHPRAPALVHGRLALVAIAAILAVSGGTMAVIGALPGVAFVLSLPAAVFGLGLTAGDGLLVGLGLAVAAAAIWGVTLMI